MFSFFQQQFFFLLFLPPLLKHLKVFTLVLFKACELNLLLGYVKKLNVKYILLYMSHRSPNLVSLGMKMNDGLVTF